MSIWAKWRKIRNEASYVPFKSEEERRSFRRILDKFFDSRHGGDEERWRQIVKETNEMIDIHNKTYR